MNIETELTKLGKHLEELNLKSDLAHVETYRGCPIFKAKDVRFFKAVIVALPTAMSLEGIKSEVDRISDFIELP